MDMVDFALGTDTAGSGRVPAAFNNLIGLKPTCGLLSTRGQAGFGGDQDDVVIMPIRNVQRRLTGNQDIRMFFVGVDQRYDSAGVQAAVARLLRDSARAGLTQAEREADAALQDGQSGRRAQALRSRAAQLRGLADRDEQVGQIDFEVAAVGGAFLGLDVEADRKSVV